MLSRRRFLVGAAMAAIGVVLAACEQAIRSVVPSPSPSATPTPNASPTPTPAPTEELTPAPTPSGPSLRQKIGQMLLVGFRGLTVEEAASTVADIRDRHLGGVIIFSVDQPTGGQRNVASPSQLTSLISGLTEAAGDAPLMVATDQEGGLVARLGPKYGFPPTRSAEELGATGDPEVTREAARAMAETLAEVGVTMNLAPVVDLAVNPDNPIIAGIDRSFSADPDVVVAHATAFIEAHHALGVHCAIKHFPGQGTATGDTHLGVVDVTDVWTDTELIPFARLIQAGLPDAVMTAHIFNAALDSDHPATLSAPTITGVLRQQLRYDGVVISDDLQMGAITDEYGYEEAVALAIEAGVDILLIANQVVFEPDIVGRTIDLIAGLVDSGRIDEARIDASWARIARLKGVA